MRRRQPKPWAVYWMSHVVHNRHSPVTTQQRLGLDEATARKLARSIDPRLNPQATEYTP